MSPTPPSEPNRPAGATDALSSAAGDVAAVLGEERELWRGRMSWRHQVGHLVAWMVASIALVWAWLHFRQPEMGPWPSRVVLLLILGSGAGLLARSALVVYRVRYRLTTQRLFVHQGILSRTTDQTELYRVDDVRMRQALFDRLFGVGDVVLVAPSDSTQPCVRLAGIVDPTTVAEHIRTQSRALRMKRSLFVEQM